MLEKTDTFKKLDDMQKKELSRSEILEAHKLAKQQVKENNKGKGL